MAKKKKKKPSKVPPKPMVPQIVDAEIAPKNTVFAQGSLLETCRTQWQYGEWAALLELSESDIKHDRDRGKLAALLAAVQGHAGNMQQSKAFAALATEWGCDRSVLARMMVSSVMNTLGRAASALGEDDIAGARFREAIATVEPHADTKLLGRTRHIRETTRMGLLPAAQQMIEADLKVATADPDRHSARMTILASEVELIRHELSLSLKRGQFFLPDQLIQPERTEDTLESRSVSQLGQDLWALERSGHKRNGFFVDFGATDGIALNNTYLLETEFGWTGLCAEPNPEFFEQLQKNRKCTVVSTCIGPTTGEKVDFVLADVYGGMTEYGDDDANAYRRTAYENEGYVTSFITQSLNDFLEQYGAPREIDFLSIDTEGSEFAILNALSFDRWRIRLIAVEHNNTPMREQLYELLTSKGYVRTEARWDDWYELS